jgi:oxygen-independent coproporphyrinogen III oxidase
VSFGLYIHIPFCQSKCHYCHFVTLPFRPELEERYQKAIIRELELFSSNPANEKTDSIYFGGGTPSIVPAGRISNLISECRKRYSIAIDCEISLEANPGTLTKDKALEFHDIGVNRISIGAQSFDNSELAVIGRIHSADMIVESLYILRKIGFSNINLDLMLGLPRQTAQSWRRNLEKLVELAVPHVSVYMLDLDDQCRLHSLIANGAIQIPDEDLISDLYLETIHFLSSCGYRQYEISNFAREGFSCRHNLKYWMREPVLGFGLGSHSFNGKIRYANNSKIDEYMLSIEKGNSPAIWHDPVSEAQAVEETLFLGLRLNKGVNWEFLRELCSKDRRDRYEDSFKKLLNEGWIEWKDAIVRLTPSGMLISNEIFQLFI